MGAHIVKRRPPVKLLRPVDLRRTVELTERQVHELILNRAHDRVEHADDDDLEAELELVDPFPKALPEGTPVSLPNTSSLRFARTLRREIAAPTPPVLPTAVPLPPVLPTASPPAIPSVSEPVLAMPEAAPLATSGTPRRSRLFGHGLSAGRVLLLLLALFLLTLGILRVLVP